MARRITTPSTKPDEPIRENGSFLESSHFHVCYGASAHTTKANKDVE